MMIDREVRNVFSTFAATIVVILTLWIMNLVTFVQTVTAETFEWAEIGVFTIIQGAGIIVWPISLVTGPMSLFM